MRVFYRLTESPGFAKVPEIKNRGEKITFMGLLNLLIKDPLTFVLLAIPLLYSIILHELAHGWVAYRMGDPTAKWQGRLTLNPLKHLDPIGTVMLFIVGFGWARPVPVNFNNIHETRKGLILVSSAGIIANMLLAFLAIFLFQLLSPEAGGVTATLLYYMAQINIMPSNFTRSEGTHARQAL